MGGLVYANVVCSLRDNLIKYMSSTEGPIMKYMVSSSFLNILY